ncbi:MAG TPA: glycosyltransferase family 4 protein [Pirellulales bacterium]|jgi:glycosyltransferase involved in cell wall biosynthesis
MRICLYTETALPRIGGQEVVVDSLAREFLALGHQPTVLAPRPKRTRLHDAEFPYPVIRHPRFISTRRLVSWYRHWLIRANDRQRFDAIHCHSVYPCGYLAGLARERLGTPIVVTSHGGDVREGNCRLVKPGLTERHALGVQMADAAIAISGFTREGFLRLYPQAANIVDIPNGVDLEPFVEQASRPNDLDASIQPGEYLLFLGRLARRKGVDVLLDALGKSAAKQNIQLVIAGEGAERPALEAQARQLGLADCVRFVGAVGGSKKIWLLQNTRCLVMPSRDWESFGLVWLEAHAAGRPVIATTLPGLIGLVQPERTGLMVAPESSTELAAALDRIVSDRALAERFGAEALRVAQQYSWRTIAERHLALYSELRERRKLPRAA